MSDGNPKWKLSEFALIASHGDDSMEQGKTLHANSCSYLHFATSYSYSAYPVRLPGDKSAIISTLPVKEREIGEMTCSKGQQVGLKPWAAAARTRPLYVGHALYQLSYWGTPHVFL